LTPKANILQGEYCDFVQMNILPIKFYKVGAIINGATEITLEQILNYNEVDKDLFYQLEVKEENFYVFSNNGEISQKSLKYYKIKSGKFYFDLGKRRVLLPKYGVADENIYPDKDLPKSIDGKFVVAFSQFTDNLYVNGIIKQDYPTEYFIKVWDGT
jgi:hypothetical protein